MKLPLRLPRLIYITGLAGSGKSTAADYLATTLTNANYSVLLYHHAEPLWEMVRLFEDLSGMEVTEDFNLSETKRLPTQAGTYRDLLIDLGLLLRKHFGEAALGTIAAKTIESFFTTDRSGKDCIALLPAVRFTSDIYFSSELSSSDQLRLNIIRPGVATVDDIGDALPTDIPTITITNDATLEEFYASLNTAIFGEATS